MAADPVVNTEELVRRGAPITLRDGSRVRIRQGRRSDGELLVRGFAHLSPESRYRRFLTPLRELSQDSLRHLTDIDHRDREEGIRTFTALMLARNREMMELVEELGPVRIVDRAADTVEVEIPLKAVGLPPSLRELLRIAARHDVAAPLAAR